MSAVQKAFLIFGCVMAAVVVVLTIWSIALYWRKKRHLKKLPPIAWKFKWKWVLWSPAYPLLMVCWLIFAFFCLWATFSIGGWFISRFIKSKPAPDRIVMAQAQEKAKDVDFGNGGADVVPFLPQGSVRKILPAPQPGPRLVFLGVLPNDARFTDVSLSGRGAGVFSTTAYLFSGGWLNPLTERVLDEDFLKSEIREDADSPVRKIQLPFTERMETHKLKQWTPMYAWVSDGRQLDVSISSSTNMEQRMVPVGPTVRTVTLPTEGWLKAWIIPIHDLEHQSRIGKQSVTAAGLNGLQFRDALRSTLAQQTPATLATSDELATMKWAERPSLKMTPPRNFLYQAVMAKIGEAPEEVLTQEMAFTFTQHAGTKVQLQLNAPEFMDARIKAQVQPAKVLLMLQRNVETTWQTYLAGQ
jgi:hypothetical protein